MWESVRNFFNGMKEPTNVSEGDNTTQDYYEHDYDADTDTQANSGVMRFPQQPVFNVKVGKIVGSEWTQEVKRAAKNLKKGYAVMINTEQAARDAVVRMNDFLGGVTFSIDGKYKKISNTYIFSPANFVIEDDDEDDDNDKSDFYNSSDILDDWL
jgi:FtsZ-interacting cell division protein YlmF